MDSSKVHYRINPRLDSNIFSRMFLCWIFPLLSHGNQQPLVTEDIFKLAPENKSEFLGDKLESWWKAEVKNAQKSKRKPRLWKVIIKTFGFKYLKFAIFAFVATLIPMLMPLALQFLIYYFEENSTTTMVEACFTALIILIILIGQVLLFNHSFFSIRYLGGQMSTACSSMIYRKLLRLPNSQDRSDGGRIITLLSNDVFRFEEAFVWLHTFLVIPATFVISGYLIWRTLGIIAIFTLLFIILQSIPLQVFSVSLLTKLREKAAEKTDYRLLILDEVINGIRVIKMYTWEKPFEQLILLARRKELDPIIKKLLFHIGLRECLSIGMFVTLYATIAILLACDNEVTSAIVFPLLQCIYHMNIQSGNRLSRCLIALSDVTASINRIENFLLLEETTNIPRLSISSSHNGVAVNIENLTASWHGSENNEVLKNISVRIVQKKLYALVGEIGSGKSSLLKVILGELKVKSGQVLNYGDISFSNQEPWLFTGSIRSNILLGESFNEEKYNEVLSCCDLLKDFEQFPCGDKTIVGERGSTLSGGQSARINLARAVYKNSDIYLLDDPLASVDYCVGNCIFEKCINDLLKNKTRIIVTQKLEYIKKVNEIIYINKGRIEYQGNYDNFQKTDFCQYLIVNHKLFSLPVTEINKKPYDSISSQINIDDPEQNEISTFTETEEFLSEYKKDYVNLKVSKDLENIEPIKYGRIPFSLFKEFYYNKCFILCVVIFLVSFCSCTGIFNYLVAVWSQNQDKFIVSSAIVDGSNKKSNVPDSQRKLFYIIGSTILGMLITYLITLTLFLKFHRKSCEQLHRNMIRNLLNATMQFFGINDSGRIINRFSQDLGIVDEQLPNITIEVLKLSMQIIIYILQIIVTSPFMSIPITILILMVYKTTIFLSKSIRSTKRLQAQAKALVLSHVNSTFNGLVTIRSAGVEAVVQKHFNIQQNNYMAANFTNIDVTFTYYLWIEIFLSTFSVLVAFCLIFLKSTGITSAAAGFIMSQTLTISRFMFVTAEYVVTLDSLMISTERTIEYTKLKQEMLMDRESILKSSSTLRNNGEIKFNDVSVKYTNSDQSVLKNISLIINPGTKVGIIGRTGAGKSSLVTALFHLAKIEGSLFVDGIDIKTVALKDLRSKISVFPQKSVLFSTSLRKNLDPLELFDDAQIWSTLKCVNLDNIFHSLDEELDQRSISNGQRQLLCLARVILKKNKILILDEATANVDAHMEELINNTIQEKFKDSTVLKISHKLNSVIDCDKILVIDEGRILEYDEPRVLLKQSNSYFSKMYHALHR